MSRREVEKGSVFLISHITNEYGFQGGEKKGGIKNGKGGGESRKKEKIKIKR